MAIHDELTPNYVGRTVHLVVDGDCRDAVIEHCDPKAETVSIIGLLGVGRSAFDRAGEFNGSWHYADHGVWREDWDQHTGD